MANVQDGRQPRSSGRRSVVELGKFFEDFTSRITIPKLYSIYMIQIIEN